MLPSADLRPPAVGSHEPFRCVAANLEAAFNFADTQTNAQRGRSIFRFSLHSDEVLSVDRLDRDMVLALNGNAVQSSKVREEDCPLPPPPKCLSEPRAESDLQQSSAPVPDATTVRFHHVAFTEGRSSRNSRSGRSTLDAATTLERPTGRSATPPPPDAPPSPPEPISLDLSSKTSLFALVSVRRRCLVKSLRMQSDRMQSDKTSDDATFARPSDGPGALKRALRTAKEPMVRHFSGALMSGPLWCAWSLNVAHYVITLFLSAWVMLKASSEADVIYRCEQDYWLTVFVTFTLSFFVDVVLFDPFMIAALYTLQARRTTSELMEIHEARASLARESLGTHDANEQSGSVAPSDSVNLRAQPQLKRQGSSGGLAARTPTSRNTALGASRVSLRASSVGFELSSQKGAPSRRTSARALIEPKSPRQVKSGRARAARCSFEGEGPLMLADQASSGMPTERV